MVESEPVENVEEENREEEEKENREEEKEIRILGLKVLAVIREAQQKHGLRSLIMSSFLKDLPSKAVVRIQYHQIRSHWLLRLLDPDPNSGF
jgi:hypothetical protein